jgi:hypothetical protein
MREERHAQDPYTPPPRHKDKSGAVMRFALIAAMLGAAVWGYTEFSSGPGLVAEESAQEQQLADAGYQVTPEAIPEAAPAEAPSATSTAPAPAASAQAPAENVPPPSTTITP